MEPFPIVSLPPCLNHLSGIRQTDIDILVITFFPHPAIEALDMAIIHRLSRPDEVQIHTVLMCPSIQYLAGKLRSIIHLQYCRKLSDCLQSLQRPCNPIACQRMIDFDVRTAPIPYIYDRQQPQSKGVSGV
jgi:hypothetical protein